MENQLGFKELYQVTLKATYQIEVGNRIIEPGEIIAVFDKILVAGFDERKNFISANGGLDNRARVWWEETEKIKLNFAQGIFSKTQMALMSNAKLLQSNQEIPVNITCRECMESDENGLITISHEPFGPVFIYNEKTGEKIGNFSINNNSITIEQSFCDVIVDYSYNYTGKSEILSIGNALTSGYISLEGKTRVKDDITGHIKTGVIKIPKLKLMSNLSMRLGQEAAPQIGQFNGVAIPTGAKGQKKVMEFIFLDDDIDSDL